MHRSSTTLLAWATMLGLPWATNDTNVLEVPSVRWEPMSLSGNYFQHRRTNQRQRRRRWAIQRSNGRRVR